MPFPTYFPNRAQAVHDATVSGFKRLPTISSLSKRAAFGSAKG